jgi:hypothetical protein
MTDQDVDAESAAARRHVGYRISATAAIYQVGGPACVMSFIRHCAVTVRLTRTCVPVAAVLTLRDTVEAPL